jgi:hypothetical protein
MKHFLCISVAVIAALGIALPASAGFTGTGPLDNDFEGRVEGDRSTYFGFNVKGTGNNRKVARVKAHLRYTCTDGDFGDASARVKGKLAVEDDRFAGTLRRRADFGATRGDNPGAIKYRIRGKFTSRRKAKGTVDAEIRFRAPEMRGGPIVRCYTGEVDWKARRGADLKPIEPLRGVGS